MKHLSALEGRVLMALAVLVSAIGLLLGGRFVAQAWPFTVDDTYITLRYARNMAEGIGPTFNMNPPRAEGYTSFLHMLLAVIPHALGMDAVLFVKLLGVVCTLGAVVITWMLAWRLCDSVGPPIRGFAAGSAVFLLAAFYATAVHAVSGMETSLAMLLLGAFVLAAIPGERAGRLACWRPFALALLGLLLGLTRPEANAVVPIVLLWRWYSVGKGRRARFGWASLLLYVVPGAAYFAWRWHYYGLFLPIPYYAKVFHQQFGVGAGTTLEFLKFLLIRCGLPVGLALLALRRRLMEVFVIAAVWTLLGVLPSPVMDFEWRYCFPAFPLWCAAGAYGFAALLQRVSSSRKRRPLAPIAVCLLLVLYLGLQWAWFLKPARATMLERRAYGNSLKNAHIEFGRLLSVFRETQPSIPLLAIGDAGSVPYYTHWEVIDIAGLNDPVIGAEGRRNPEAVLSRHPDLVVLASQRADRFIPNAWFPWETELYEAVRRAGMRRLGLVPFSAGSSLWVMGIPNSPIGLYMRQLVERRKAEQRQEGQKTAAGSQNSVARGH